MLTAQGFTTTKPKTKKTQSVQLLPHDEGSEIAVLGGCLVYPDALIEIPDLQPKHFFIGNYGLLFGVLKDLYDQHQRYDLIMVSNEMEKRGLIKDFGGVGALDDLMILTPKVLNVPFHAASVMADSARRDVIATNQKIAALAYDRSIDTVDLLNTSSQMLAEISPLGNTAGAKPISSGVSKFLDKLEYVQEHGSVAGLQTGVKALDKILGGLQRKKLHLLAGRPGMGKSAKALQIAHNVAKTGKSVLIFSLEMSEEDQVARLVSQVSGVPYNTFNLRILGENFDKAVEAVTRHISNLPITFDDTPALTIPEMKNIATRELVKNGLDLVIIDHLGIAKSTVKGEGIDKANDIADGALALCKQLNLPVLGLVQLNRDCEKRNDKRPMMSDIRQTGKFEENADVVMALYRDVYYNPDTEFPNLGEIGVLKNRGGEGMGVASVHCNMACARFTDLETRTEPLDY